MTASPDGDAPSGEAGQILLTFDRVSKVFPDGTVALRDVSFRLAKGEFLTIVGPSGCGKSTILRIASGLLPATEGEVIAVPDNVGYVFQDPTLLPWRTVQKNVELLAELAGKSGQEREQLAAEAIALVGLEGFDQHHPQRLSGGMRMRTSLARSLTLSPRLFLFDEPFGALDEITRGRLNEELLRLFAAQRFAGLFITHSIFEAVFLSTRVIVMSPRPGEFVAEYEVPFPYPRDPELRFDRDFAELSHEVAGALRRGHG